MTQKNKFTLLVLLIISFLVILINITTKNPFLENFDHSIFVFINTTHFPTFLNTTALLITKLGNPYESLSIFIVFSIFLLANRRRVSFYIFTIATALGTIIPQMIKFSIERVRPISRLLTESDPSFPSGHATISLVFLLTVLLLIAPTLKNTFLNISAIVLSSIIFPLVALSRIYLSVHWASDVLAGAILGCICYVISDLKVSFFHKNN